MSNIYIWPFDSRSPPMASATHAEPREIISGRSNPRQVWRNRATHPAKTSPPQRAASQDSRNPGSCYTHVSHSVFPPDDGNGNSFAHAPPTLEEEVSGPATPRDSIFCEQPAHLKLTDTVHSLPPGQLPDVAPPNAVQHKLSADDEHIIKTHWAEGQHDEAQQYFLKHRPLQVERSVKLTKKGEPRKNAGVKKATCNICGKVKSSLQKMARHIKKHMGLEGRHLCGHPSCGRKYGDKQELDRHLRNTHNERKRAPNKAKDHNSEQATSTPFPELTDASSTSAGADGTSTNDTSKTSPKLKEKRRRSRSSSILSSFTSPKKRKLRGDNSPSSPDPSSHQPQAGPVVSTPQPIQEHDYNDQLVDPVHLSYARNKPAALSELIHEEIPASSYPDWHKEYHAPCAWIPGSCCTSNS